MKTAKRRSPIKHDSQEFMSKVELALNFAKMAIQENRFKATDLVHTFGMPTNITRAANDLGIFVNESASSRHPSWKWVLEEPISADLAEQVALSCKEMKRVENQARNRSKVKAEAEPLQEEKAKAEVFQLPVSQELFTVATNDPSIELLTEIKQLMSEQNKLLRDLQSSWS